MEHKMSHKRGSEQRQTHDCKSHLQDVSPLFGTGRLGRTVTVFRKCEGEGSNSVGQVSAFPAVDDLLSCGNYPIEVLHKQNGCLIEHLKYEVKALLFGQCLRQFETAGEESFTEGVHEGFKNGVHS